MVGEINQDILLSSPRLIQECKIKATEDKVICSSN